MKIDTTHAVELHLIWRRCQSVMVNTSNDSRPVRKRMMYVAITSCCSVMT